ncbi:MAG: amino acid adenylation domain-containing protein [Sphingomonas sp.]
MEGDEFAFPLSFAQRRLWFLSQLDPSNTIYNLPLAAPFDVAVHPAVLERSINEIVKRHETLRTVFADTDGEPVQIVRPSLFVPLAVVDLRPLSPEQQQAETMRLTAEMAQRPFDLARGPLLRTALIQLAPERHVFVLVMHHIVSDGWSLGVFWRELVLLYNALYMGAASPLPELPIQYADFAVWQRERLEGARLDELGGYWRSQLDGLPTLQFPTDRPRPPVLTYRGAFEQLKLTRRLTAALRELGREEGATPFMTLFAAFAVLLQRYTGQDDIVMGMPTASRDHEELEGLIGFFVNSLVLRVDASGDPGFRELLGRVKKAALDAYAHQEMPFEKLVEEIQPERDLSRNPLFQISFQLISHSGNGSADKRESTPAIPVNRGSATFDIAVNLWETADEIHGQIEYSTDLFDAASIARLSASLRTLLGSIAAAPDSRLSELEILGEAERQLLDAWNETGMAVPEQPVHRLFEQQAERSPDAPAVSSHGRELSYGALNRNADVLARRMRGLGVGRDDIVAVCMERGIAMVTAMLAVLKSGAAYLPLDPSHPADRIAFMLTDSGARLVLSDSAAAGDIPATDAGILLVDEEHDVADDAADPGAGCDVAADDLCYVVYTSGSTGRPKGVAVPHRGLTNLVAWHRHAFGVVASDRASQLASAAFDACGWEIWPYLAAGASVHVVTDAVRGIPRDLVKALADRKISIAFVPTPLAQMMFDEPAFADLPLRYLLTGGDKLTRSPPAGLDFAIVNNYGPSEYSVVATSCLLAVEDGVSPPIGRPIANARVHLLDRNRKPVPIGAVGELYIGGPGLARGYHGRPELTAERFGRDPFSDSDFERLYRTGDLVRHRADGMLEFVGRADSQIKLRGFRIELGEIEAALARDYRVREAVVVLVAGEGGEQLVAYIVPHAAAAEGGELAAQVRADLANRLPEYMVPGRIVALPEFPQLPNGKIDRQALARREVPRGNAAGDFARAPRTPLEQALVMIWGDILNVEHVGIDDNFFEIGGHSLLAARLISRVRDWLKADVPLQALFRAPTPALFAARVLSDAANPAVVEKAAELILSLSTMSDDEARNLLGKPPPASSEGSPGEERSAFRGEA